VRMSGQNAARGALSLKGGLPTTLPVQRGSASGANASAIATPLASS
jgi:hypothetical protein